MSLRSIFRKTGGFLALTLCLATGTARADLPPGFTRTLVATDVGAPTCLAFGPNGRIFIGDLLGGVFLVTPQGQSRLMDMPDIFNEGEHGILGMAIDPAFATNGYLYIYYSAVGPYNKIARYTVENDQIDPGTRTIIWQNPDLCAAGSHQGGSIKFGPDGNLYLSTGDQLASGLAMDLGYQHGKILRMAPDGSVPPDNPFLNVPGAQPPIWARGFRNPFRFVFDGPDMLIADVGDSTWEELSRATPAAAGGNFGWPDMEGPECYVSNCGGYIGPMWWYRHDDPVYSPTEEACIIAGPRYTANDFPAEYRGNIFVADFAVGWIRRLVLDANNQVTQDILFDSAPSCRTITSLELGPDGALYYTTIQDATSELVVGVYKITANTPGNQAPVVVAGGTPASSPTAPLTVQFSSAGTYDPDNGPGPLSFHWDFGDGQSSSAPNPSHPYTRRGLFPARLTVSDGADQTPSSPINILVGHAPVPAIHVTSGTQPYRADDTISFTLSATDVEDGQLPPSALTYRIVLAHLNHVHPISGPFTGITAAQFVIPDSGHDPEDTHYRLVLDVVDSDGTPGHTEVDLVPEAAILHIDTQPSGIPVFLDGRALATPRDYQSLVGFHHHMRAQIDYAFPERVWTFDHWNTSPGTEAEFDFVSPEGGLTLAATYYPDPCTGDFNNDGLLNVIDYIAFLNAYAAGLPSANCDGSTAPPVLNVNDFICFSNAYAIGCRP